MLFSCLLMILSANLQDILLEAVRKELKERPTEKLVEDLRKKVKILQVCR